MSKCHLFIHVAVLSSYAQIRNYQNKAAKLLRKKTILVMNVWTVSTDKVQPELNLLSTNISYSFLSSFISDACQLALISFGDNLGEDTAEKPLSQRFPCSWRKSDLEPKSSYSVWNGREQSLALENPWSFVECLILIRPVWLNPLWLIVCLFMMKKICSKTRPVWSGSLELNALKRNKSIQKTGCLPLCSKLLPQHLP